MIISESYEEHMDLLERVLTTLLKNGIKIKVNKCEFLKEEVSFLGHIVSKTGIRKCSKFIDKIKKFPKPNNVNQMRQFLGLANFQRKFVNNFSTVAKPLTSCTSGPKKKKIEWSKEMDTAFEEIKNKLAEEISLSFPDYRKTASTLELYVDASGVGAGCCLMQRQNDAHKIIAFSSMTFNSAEQHYAPIDRELLALRWGVKNFRKFLFGVRFTIFTDHRPLLFLKNMSRENSRLVRTISELEEYDYEIRYIPGKQNEAADTLSRIINVDKEDEEIAEDQLPKGLILLEKIDGGGNSMFEALWKVLNDASIFAGKFEHIGNSHDLRKQLVAHLISNVSKLNIEYSKGKLKEIKSIRHNGVLPCYEILVAASDLFKVEIHVHHGMQAPIIYKSGHSDNNTDVVHIQCLAGVHFNPVINRRNVEQNVKAKLINIVDVRPNKIKDCGKDSCLE